MGEGFPCFGNTLYQSRNPNFLLIINTLGRCKALGDKKAVPHRTERRS
jgi:hypothetical protein